jgi:hypothetical protein
MAQQQRKRDGSLGQTEGSFAYEEDKGKGESAIHHGFIYAQRRQTPFIDPDFHQPMDA